MLTKRQIKKAYNSAELSLTPAVEMLMFDHGMDKGDAIRFLLF